MRLPEVPYADGIGKRGQLQFYGLDHNLGAGDGGLWDMQNLTSDYFSLHVLYSCSSMPSS